MAFGNMGGLNGAQQPQQMGQPQQGGGGDWLKWLQETLLGKPASSENVDIYNPQQQQAFSQILQQALSGLKDNPTDFGPIENKARSDFAQNTIPSIAERFTSLGSQGSSAFANQLGAAGSGLETNLAALKSSHGLQRQQLLQNLAGLGLTQQQDTNYTPSTQGILNDPEILKMLGSIAGSFFGPIGSAAGGAIGSGISSFADLFKNKTQKIPQQSAVGLFPGGLIPRNIQKQMNDVQPNYNY